jgi:hypothetical protein
VRRAASDSFRDISGNAAYQQVQVPVSDANTVYRNWLELLKTD